MVYDGVIRGKTVLLRSVNEEDAEVTFRMRSDPEKSRYIHAAKGTVENQREFIRKQMATLGDYLFIIEDLDGNPLGMKGLYHLDNEKKEIESGRFIGYGSQIQNMEALLLSLDFAFETLHVNRINMAALETNTVMLGIQKKLGVEFTYRDKPEGIDQDNIHSFLAEEIYARTRPKIQALIDRFAKRI